MGARQHRDRLTPAIQEALLALLCYDNTPGGAKAVRGIVSTRLYDPYFRDIAEEADRYLEQWKKPPGEHTFDLLQALKERSPEKAESYDQIYSSLIQTKDAVNRDYVMSRATLFVRRQKMKAALAKAIPLLGKEDEASVNEASAIFASVAKNEVTLGSPGTLLNDPAQALRFLERKDSLYLPTGIPELDKFDLGPVRGGLWLLVAPPNSGKTQSAVHLGKMAHLAGSKVCHVTLEMSEEKICQRYCQSFFSVTKREAEHLSARHFGRDELGRMTEMELVPMGKRPHLEQSDIHQVLIRKLEGEKRRAPFWVKQFPTGQLNIRGLNAYLDHLEGVNGFVPDLLIVDYADIMDVDPKHRREALGKLYIDLRGIAVERNIAVVTFSQSNKLGASARVIDMKHAAEDWSKNATADTIITYNQTPAEYELGLARLFVAKARDDVKHFQVLISQQYAACQFCLSSARMVDSTYWPQVEGEKESDDEDNDEAKPKPRKSKHAS